MIGHKAQFRLWYAGCLLLGLPWWMVVRFSLSLYVLAYFWIWVGLVLATWRVGWGRHRVAGILIAIAMNLVIGFAAASYFLSKLSDADFP